MTSARPGQGPLARRRTRPRGPAAQPRARAARRCRARSCAGSCRVAARWRRRPWPWPSTRLATQSDIGPESRAIVRRPCSRECGTRGARALLGHDRESGRWCAACCECWGLMSLEYHRNTNTLPDLFFSEKFGCCGPRAHKLADERATNPLVLRPLGQSALTRRRTRRSCLQTTALERR